MSEAILLTGKRGEGKTLSALQLAARYLEKGRPIATNVDIFVEHLLPAWNKTNFYRLPDCPSADDLEALPLGNPGLYWDDGEIKMNSTFSDEMNGCLLLDETGTFLNSREWRNDDRMGAIQFFSHSRKYGWDLLFIAQHQKMLDSQLRESLFELHATAKRTDKIGIPVVSFLAQYLFSMKVRLPKMHVITTRYGFAHGAPVADTQILGGADLYSAYSTTQKINPLSKQPGTPTLPNKQVYGCGLATMLSPWYIRGRYRSLLQMYGKIAFLFLVLGSGLGAVVGHFAWPNIQIEKVADSTAAALLPELYITSIIKSSSGFTAILSNGQMASGTHYKIDASGEQYKINGQWLRKVQK